ncbi:hypothetical protein LR48_Vigan10g125800 [Vigna angularis]|uniref:Secreted protein n=1 Tax=Phaseolus angularis TaxID=3914 RepID=A0A0L9VJY8_PHAAN|nr:hypothetical protein LR48_Vigan10g125800 [Vigna angularis]
MALNGKCAFLCLTLSGICPSAVSTGPQERRSTWCLEGRVKRTLGKRCGVRRLSSFREVVAWR